MVRRRPYSNGLLGEAMEEQPAGMGAPTIEAEGEFVEVVVEMPMLDAALMVFPADPPTLSLVSTCVKGIPISSQWAFLRGLD